MILWALACRPGLLEAVHVVPPPVDGAAVLVQTLRITLPSPGTVEAACFGALGDEAHYAASLAPARAHDLVFAGLLANHRYTCWAVDGDGRRSLAVDLQTGVLDGLPDFVTTGTPSGAYHLFNLQRGAAADGDHGYVVVVDPDGQLRWRYDIGPLFVVDIDAQWTGDRFHFGGGWAHLSQAAPHRGLFLDVDVAGNIVLEREAPAFGLGYNHHSERLADGSTLSLTFSQNARDDQQWIGVGVEQWHPDTGLVYTFDTQALVDAEVLPLPPVDLRSPYHANSVHLLEDAQGEAMWLSLYARRQLWRIDKVTGARTHVFGVGGDMTLVDNAGNSLPIAEWPWVQHDPDYTTDGRILLYDNGAGRPGGSYSRVAEYAVDLDTHQARLLWSWTEEGWYNPVLGDADRLENGNVLLARGFNRTRTPESDDVSQILELVPETGEVLWRLRFADPDWVLFRAQRIDGCALFANARYCDAVAERIQAAFGDGGAR